MTGETKYWKLVTLLGFGLLAVIIVIFGMETSEPLGRVALFAVLMTVSKLQYVPMNVGTLTMDFGFLYAGVTVLGPITAITLKAVTTYLTQIYLLREDKTPVKYMRASFNAAQFVLSGFLGYGIYKFLWLQRGQFLWWGLPEVIGVLVYFAANNFFIELSVYLHCKKLKEHRLRALFYVAQAYLISFPFGVMASYLYRTKGFYYAIAVLTTGLVVSYIYTLYVKLKEKNRELSALLNSATILVSSLDYEQVLEKIIISIESLVFWDTVCICVNQNSTLVPVMYEGFKDSDLTETKILPSMMLGGQKIFAKDAVIVNRCDKDPEFSRLGNFPKDTKTLMAVPMIINNELLGGIVITSRQPCAYTKRHLHLMSLLSNQSAVAISNAKQYSDTSEMAITDDLTKLYNYRYIYDELRRQWERADYYKEDLSLIIMDIDRFKEYNDAYGHVVGDMILENLSFAIKNSVRNGDIVGRYGGEEFCVILPGTSVEKASAIGERIRKTIEKTPLGMDPLGEPIYITVSAGVATYPKHAANDKELVIKADDALMFGAKRQGRNKVVLYNDKCKPMDISSSEIMSKDGA